GDLCGFRHDSLDESPKRGNFQNPTCASSDSIDFAAKKPSVMVRVGTYPWDDSKLPRGAVSSDGGISWTQFGSEPAGSNGSGITAISADGAAILWAARDARPARSTDHGATWVQIKGLPDPVKVPDWANIGLRLASDRVNPNRFYAFDLLAGRAYVSKDGGANFEFTTGVLTALPEYNLVVGSMQAVPGLEGHVWVTAGKELFFSTDGAQTFSEAPNVEESYAVGFGLAAPGKPYPTLYLSGKVSGVSGFFRSDDQGANFARINDDAHQYGGSNLIIGDPRVHGRVYIAPGGRGILYGEPR
ncbi:MAG TPA: xyloglucanase, partial [Gemmatimonadales bacterium]|nr:xyloglucanase [Gemmatimonadales bacterium]